VNFWQFIDKQIERITDFAASRPTNVMNIFRATIGLLVLIYRDTLTPEIVVAITGIMESVLQGITAKVTVPVQRVRQVREDANAAVDQRVADILASPDEVRMRTGGSGTGIGR
jgi:hypothetical protein